MRSKQEAEQEAEKLLKQAQQNANQKLGKKVKNIPRRFRITALKPLPPHEQVRLFEKAKSYAQDDPLYKKANYIFVILMIYVAFIFIKKLNFFILNDDYNIMLYIVLGSFILLTIIRDRLVKKYLVKVIEEYQSQQAP